MENKTAIGARKGTDKRTKLRVAVQNYRRDANGKGHYNELANSAVIIDLPSTISKSGVSEVVKQIQDAVLKFAGQ